VPDYASIIGATQAQEAPSGLVDLSWLFFWKRRSHADVRVRLFTRAGCHLCETAWQQLQDAQRRWRFVLDSVDVDTDPALAAEHGETVPVVAVNGKVRFRGSINPVLLTRLLRAQDGCVRPK